MADSEQGQRRDQWTLALVSLNFLMFLILFSGLGFLVWRSLGLISQLERNLGKVEQTMVQVQHRIDTLDVDAAMNRLMANATQRVGQSIQTSLDQANFGGSLAGMTQRMENVQARIDQIGEAVRAANARLREIDPDTLAQQVSYNILKNLGDGLRAAAESRRMPAQGQ
jgi:hypothetical protein